MKVIAIIQARMLSQRLRGKTLMSVNNTPLLYRVVNNAQKLTFIDEVIVATTSLDSDQPIIAAAHAMGVKVIAVLSFFYLAASATFALRSDETLLTI